MIDINTYIKNDNIVNIIKPYQIISSVDEVEIIICNIIDGKRTTNLIFDNNELKKYFYYRLDEYNVDYSYINCNSNLERFFNDIQQDNLLIFNNINNCKDENIIKIIKNTPGLIVC